MYYMWNMSNALTILKRYPAIHFKHDSARRDTNKADSGYNIAGGAYV